MLKIRRSKWRDWFTVAFVFSLMLQAVANPLQTAAGPIGPSGLGAPIGNRRRAD